MSYLVTRDDDGPSGPDTRSILLARLFSPRARRLSDELFLTLAMVVLGADEEGVCEDDDYYLSGIIAHRTGRPWDLVRWHLAVLETRGFIRSFHGEDCWCVRVLVWEKTEGRAQ